MFLLIILAMGAVISLPFVFVEWNPTVLSYVSMKFICYTWLVSVVVIGNRLLHALERIQWDEIWPEPKYVPHPGCEYRRISPKPPRAEPPRKMKIVEFLPGTLSCVGVEFYCDEDASNLGKSIRKRRMRVLTSRKAGMSGKSDREQLLRAQRDRRSSDYSQDARVSRTGPGNSALRNFTLPTGTGVRAGNHSHLLPTYGRSDNDMTDRTSLLLHALTVCVRAFTIPQAMRLLGIQDTANFRRFIRPLVAAELVEVVKILAKPVPEMREPLLTRNPEHLLNGRTRAGDGLSLLSSERFGVSLQQVLYQARRRWAGLSAVNTTVVVATRKANHIHGVRSIGQLAKPLQASHDLAVSEVFLTVTAQNSKMQHWYGEDFTDKSPFQNLVPDALILNAQGKPQNIIEVVGADYDNLKLERVHQHCHARALSYELW